jgi:inhibitor of KinA
MAALDRESVCESIKVFSSSPVLKVTLAIMTFLQPLGDQAVLASFESETEALRWSVAVRRLSPDWLVDVVSAYRTVAVYFNLDRTTLAPVLQALDAVDPAGLTEVCVESRLHVVPCCYDFPLDLPRIAEATGVSVEEIIGLHSATEYTVYAIGFCPGFPYLGYLPEPLCGVPRLPAPRLRVEAGSVGLTGRQTGIYTETRPGGWNLVGRTPLELVCVADDYFPLSTGDRVRFVRIDESDFRRLRGQRL